MEHSPILFKYLNKDLTPLNIIIKIIKTILLEIKILSRINYNKDNQLSLEKEAIKANSLSVLAMGFIITRFKIV